MVSPAITQHGCGEEPQKLHMSTKMGVGEKGEGGGKPWGLRIKPGLRLCPKL